MSDFMEPVAGMGPVEGHLFLDIAYDDPVMASDADLQTLFHNAMFVETMSEEEREEWRESLIDYMMEEYGVDFVEAMDWETFRAWYD